MALSRRRAPIRDPRSRIEPRSTWPRNIDVEPVILSEAPTQGHVGFGGGVSPVRQYGIIAKGSVAVWRDQGELVDGSAAGLVGEAPQDGQTYGRSDGGWVLIDGGGAGTLISITAGHGLTGGTIVDTGTIALQVPVSLADGGTGVAAGTPAMALSALGGAPINSPALTGTPTLVTTPAQTDSSSRLATTAWVTNKIASATGGVSQITATTPINASAATGNVTLSLGVVPPTLGGTGATSAAAGLTALGGAPVASPAFTGNPTATTQTTTDDSTRIATTAFVHAALGEIDALPTGGAQYDVLSKASATAGDVEWRGAGVRPNNNTVIGAGALAAATTGMGLVAIGNLAMTATTTGQFSVAIGNGALTTDVASAQNVAVGNLALWRQNTTGISANTAVGASALANNVSGTNNVAIGRVAGNLPYAGSSVFIGAEALGPTGQDNQIVIGYLALGNGSNTITLGNTDITALYTRAGLVLGNAPTGGAQGTGTVNCTDGYFINGEPHGFAQTAGWVAGTNPDGAILYTNNTGRTLTIVSIVGQREVANTTPAVINVHRANATTPIAAGDPVTVVGSFDAGGTPAPGQTLNLTSGTLLLADGERLGLVVNAGVTFDLSIASITVYLA